MTTVYIECNAGEVAAKFNKAAKDIPDDVLLPVAEWLVAYEVMPRFKKTTATWSHQPYFDKIVSASGGTIQILAGTDDFIYSIVNDGSKPHTITARNAKVLAFQANYAPKTTPGSLQSRRGGASGPMVFAKSVRHPGTKARKFTEIITKEVDKKAKTRLVRAVNRWIRKLT